MIMKSALARPGRTLQPNQCYRCGDDASRHRLPAHRGACRCGCTLTQNQALNRPCVNAGEDLNHEQRPTTLLGPRLGWWCTTCLRARTRSRKTTGKAKRLERVYGLSEEDTAAIRAEMPVNAIGVRVWRGCETATGASKAVAADHDHEKEAAGVPMRDTIRGFLCSSCNQAIEKYGVAGFLRLIDYIRDPPAPKALAKLDAKRLDDVHLNHAED
jgi:hypothetical protein